MPAAQVYDQDIAYDSAIPYDGSPADQELDIIRLRIDTSQDEAPRAAESQPTRRIRIDRQVK